MLETTGRYENATEPEGIDPEALRRERIPIVDGGFPADVSDRLHRQRTLLKAVIKESGRE
ncbi:MAG: hypothetical protein ABJQ29_03275 [Luteolibacter sp.]